MLLSSAIMNFKIAVLCYSLVYISQLFSNISIKPLNSSFQVDSVIDRQPDTISFYNSKYLQVNPGELI